MAEQGAVESWLAALDDRYLADLSTTEVARALRALSSCYVERRSRIREGAPLDSRGKRAAFALFYGPVHFLVVREIVRAIPGAHRSLTTILDLGCGTGAAGAAWALESRTRRISGIDRHPWAVAESTWTYRALGLRGRSRQGDFSRGPFRVGRGSGIIAAYAINELPVAHREIFLDTLIAEHAAGASVLIVEPIARMVAPWWAEWTRILHRTGGRSDEWRVAADLPDRQRELAGAAGLDPRVLTARSLWLESASS